MADDARSSADLVARVTRTRPGREGSGLTRLCRELADGLGFEWVELRLVGTGPVSASPLTYQWPERVGGAGMISRLAMRRFPVMLAGRQVGLLRFTAGSVLRLGAARSRTLADIVDALGPVLYLVRLEQEQDAALVQARDHAERIAAVRRQAFAERDQERRDLERDLHDGAQHHLVALRMAVGLLEIQLGAGDLKSVRSGLAGLNSRIEQASQVLLTTAAGSCPPILVEQGLEPALLAEVADGRPPVQLLTTPNPWRRFPLEIEIAVFFTCLEAVNNARKHAPGAKVTLRLTEGPRELGFAVVDNGPGLDEPEPVDSFGLVSMRTRIHAVGGSLDLWTLPGAGTTIVGRIPI